MDMATRAPPVTKPTATGRTCAKRMIMPLPALFVTTAERLFSMEWLHQACNAPLVAYALHWTPCSVPGATLSTIQFLASQWPPGSSPCLHGVPEAARSRLLLGRSAAADGSIRIGGTARHVC